MGLKCRLEGASVENLRGYVHAEISFPELRILVGENNEGKSSLLKMIHRVISDTPPEFWAGDRYFSAGEYQFWMPANNSAKRARRLTLRVKILDGRSARKYGVAKDEIVDLRLGVRKSDGKARLNIGSPRRGESHDLVAADLLQELTSSLRLILIPPVRDASSSRYTDHLLRDVRQGIREKLTHTQHGGTSREYRNAKKAVQAIESIVHAHSSSFELAGETVLSRMVRQTSVRFTADIGELTDWILRNIGVVLSTGSHDELMVSPSEVGNGLQSLIDLSLVIARAQSEHDSARDLLIFVEEPEVFLHPSAQRELMASIRSHCSSGDCRMVLTTHSPIIVDESRYPEVALVRDHYIYEPQYDSDARNEINSGLLASKFAEVFFAEMVLLVEGETDAAYVKGLVSRLRASNPNRPGLSKIVVQPLGGKKTFAPWVKLLRSYSRASKPAIAYECLADADALVREDGAPSAIEGALQECGTELEQGAKEAARILTDLAYDEYTKRQSACNDVNEMLVSHRFMVFPIDLEWAVIDKMSESTRRLAAETIGASGADKEAVARHLGSKAKTGKAKKGAKPSWVIGQLIQLCEKADVAREVIACLDRLFAGRGYTRWRTLSLSSDEA